MAIVKEVYQGYVSLVNTAAETAIVSVSVRTTWHVIHALARVVEWDGLTEYGDRIMYDCQGFAVDSDHSAMAHIYTTSAPVPLHVVGITGRTCRIGTDGTSIIVYGKNPTKSFSDASEWYAELTLFGEKG
jgi:hypothetical protein